MTANSSEEDWRLTAATQLLTYMWIWGVVVLSDWLIQSLHDWVFWVYFALSFIGLLAISGEAINWRVLSGIIFSYLLPLVAFFVWVISWGAFWLARLMPLAPSEPERIAGFLGVIALGLLLYAFRTR